MYRVLPCVAVLSVALIAGCGSSGSDGEAASSAVAGTSTTTDDAEAKADNGQVSTENQIADCMKQQGFTYIPRPVVSATAGKKALVTTSESSEFTGTRSFLQPDDKLRPWREKYGFMDALAEAAYPNDPQLKATRKTSKASNDPNQAIVAALDPAQRAAYNIALMGDAKAHVYDPKEGKSTARQQKYDDSCQGKVDAALAEAAEAENSSKEAAKAADDAKKIKARYKSDPKVADAADEYANCLKERGYPARGSDPLQFQDDLSEKFGGANEAADYSVSEAKAKLETEIKVALADLECRSPYVEIMRTKYPTVLSGQVDVGGGVG